MGGTHHRPLSFSVEPSDIHKTDEELVPIRFIFARFDKSRATIRKLIGSQRAHEVGLPAGDIAEVMTVFRHNLDGIGIVFIVWLWNQGALHATDIAADALTVVDTGYLQDAEVVVDRKPTAISTTPWFSARP